MQANKKAKPNSLYAIYRRTRESWSPAKKLLIYGFLFCKKIKLTKSTRKTLFTNNHKTHSTRHMARCQVVMFILL
jgi:hypothetical protein